MAEPVNTSAKRATVWRRLWVRFCGYRRFQGFGLPGGVRVLRVADERPSLMIASRHPRWSITWLWWCDVTFGRAGSQLPWWRRFALKVAPSICKQASLHLGWVHFCLHWQDAMAYSPGYPRHDRRQWLRYCERVARRRAKAIAAEAYRAELARMLEPTPEDHIDE